MHFRFSRPPPCGIASDWCTVGWRESRSHCRCAQQNQTANPPEATPDAPPPAAAVPSGPTELSAAKSAALQEVNSALDAVRDAQRDGDFAQYGEALQRLNDAMDEYQSAD